LNLKVWNGWPYPTHADRPQLPVVNRRLRQRDDVPNVDGHLDKDVPSSCEGRPPEVDPDVTGSVHGTSPARLPEHSAVLPERRTPPAD